MRLKLLILILCFSYAHAESQDEAVKKTTEAISKTEIGKEVSKNIEKTIVKFIPIDKDTAAVVGSVAVTAAQGKVDTKNIKNMDMDFANGKVRPDLEYNFKENNSSFLLQYNLSY